MEASKPPPCPFTSPPAAGQRQHRKLGLALIVIASVIAFLAVFSIWANRQLLETDSWVETSTELLEDEEIRGQLSNFMVDTIYANVDVQGELAQTLPPRLQPLAGPAAGALRTLLDRLANEALQRPRVQEAWENINRAMHERLITVVEEDVDEPVTLDLGDIVEGVGAQAGLNIADRLPPDAGQIEVIPAEDLSTARKAVDLLEKLAIWLTLLALILFGRRDLPGPRLAPRGPARGRLRLHRRRDCDRGRPELRRELRRGHACLDGRRQAGRGEHLRDRNLPAVRRRRRDGLLRDRDRARRLACRARRARDERAPGADAADAEPPDRLRRRCCWCCWCCSGGRPPRASSGSRSRC